MGIKTVRHALSPYRPDKVAYRGAVKGRLCAERWALAMRTRAMGGQAQARRGRILAYHSVGTPEWGVNDVSPSDFERHLQIAVDDGWSFATPADVIAEPGKPPLALTFDDGLASVLANAAPVLRHHGIPATMFVVTGWADGQPPSGQGHLVIDWGGGGGAGRAGRGARRRRGRVAASHPFGPPPRLRPARAGGGAPGARGLPRATAAHAGRGDQ